MNRKCGLHPFSAGTSNRLNALRSKPKRGRRVGSKIGGGHCAAQIIAVHGRDATKHVLDLAWAAIESRPEPDPEVIGRLARLMREIEASQHQQIHQVAARYSA